MKFVASSTNTSPVSTFKAHEEENRLVERKDDGEIGQGWVQEEVAGGSERPAAGA